MTPAAAGATAGLEGLMGREEFSAGIGEALGSGRGFAAAKLGGSERAWLQYPMVRSSRPAAAVRAFEVTMAHRSLRHAGVWPTDPGFLAGFAERFAADLREIDAIGLFPSAAAEEALILGHHRPPGRAMWFEDQEPPLDPAEPCWLEHLRGRRVLLVCPFASVLAERARGALYEEVWSATGKRWFEPARVDHLEFPYGFDPATRRRYGSALELLDELAARVDAADADCVLIAAGGLGLPLAARVRRAGGVGLSLGGHLQIVFGVHGERWLGRADWDRIINDAWVGVPDRYRPDPAWTDEDYW
jgi:hypothetical protein